MKLGIKCDVGKKVEPWLCHHGPVIYQKLMLVHTIDTGVVIPLFRIRRSGSTYSQAVHHPVFDSFTVGKNRGSQTYHASDVNIDLHIGRQRRD